MKENKIELYKKIFYYFLSSRFGKNDIEKSKVKEAIRTLLEEFLHEMRSYDIDISEGYDPIALFTFGTNAPSYTYDDILYLTLFAKLMKLDGLDPIEFIKTEMEKF